MKIKLVSDIHLSPTNLLDWRKVVADEGEYMIINGDTCRIEYQEILVDFLERLCHESNFEKIIFIFGNHEFYNSHRQTCIGLIALLRQLTQHLHNLVILDNDTIDLGENIRLYGGTMWHSSSIEYNPTLDIFDEHGHPVSRVWLQREYYKFLHGLETAINGAHRDNKRLIVASHYAPIYIEPSKITYYPEIIRYLNKMSVYIWMYGHTHLNMDFLTPGDTRIVSNQCPGVGFETTKVIRFKDEYKKYV